MAFQSQRISAEELPAFMQLARQRYEYAMQLDAEDRELAQEDVLFTAALPVKGAGSTQWHKETAETRTNLHRPVLTENRLPTFTAQVVNDGRQSKPAIKIAPLDNGTKETAEFYQGRIRQIEYDCQADVAYDTSREQQVTCGRAFLRVTWAYVPGTFKKQAAIEPITNQFSVVFGPCRKYDCSDADYCFVLSLITKEEHARKYGTETVVANTDFASPANIWSGWLGCGPNGEMVQEAEYWVKEYKKRTLCRLSDGSEYWEDEVPPGIEALGITIEEVREEQDVTVVQYIIDGAEIQDETEYFGPYIGIVPVWGREWFIDGRRRTSSLIRYAKDPQRLLNLYVSNIAEQIAMLPKTPYMVPVGGIPAGSQAQWDNLATDPRPYAYFNAYDAMNKPLPPPSRVQNEPPIQALVAGYNQAVDAIKAAMGIFDASLGAQSNEESGIAINSRKRESDNANFHFHDNEARSRNHIGRILLVMIPELDKGTGMRAVRSVDGKTSMVMVGKPYKNEEGKIVHHDLGKGDYGVAVDSGPSYNSMREEAFGIYSQIAKSDKNFMAIAGDKVFRNMDAPGADEIADRYEKMLPAPLQKQKPGNQPDPAKMAQQLQMVQQQSMDMIDRLTQEITSLQDDIKAQRVQAEYRLRGIELQENTKKEIAIAQLRQDEGLDLLKSDLAAIKHQLELAQAERDRQHSAEQADLDRKHDASQAETSRVHQSGQDDLAHQRNQDIAAAQQPPAEPTGPQPQQEAA